MPKRAKEEDRIEKIIRGLLKLPDNRRCINCNCLGPQYVCTTFWTFVCTSCSGIHREFTHRVKSVSMAKFTSEELGSLQAGGNQRAREIYFKDWDPHRHSCPDNSNLQRLRDFIKHVYVDRKYCGAIRSRSVDMLPKLKMGDREEFFDNRRIGARSRSPLYNEKPSSGGRNAERSFRYYYDERSPRVSQENSRYGGHRRSPVHFEVVDYRVRDNGFGSGRRSPSTMMPDAEPKQGRRSTDSPSLHVNESPNANEGRNNGKTSDSSASASTQACSSGQQPAEVNPEEHKNGTSESLIDFNTDPEPSDAAVALKTQENPPCSGDGDKWASFESSQKKASQPSAANPLECLLLELSVPPTMPAGGTSDVPKCSEAPSGTPAGDNLPSPADNAPLAAPTGQMSEANTSGSDSTTNKSSLPPDGCAIETPPVALAPLLPNGSGDPIVKDTDEQNLHTVPSLGILDNQPWAPSVGLDTQGPVNTSAEQVPQSVSKSAQDTSSGLGSQPPQVEAKSSSRMELPADLFTGSHSSAPPQGLYWPRVPPQAMGFGTQYHPFVMPVQGFPNSAQSSNPFDLNAETTQAQNQAFASMGSLQGALPHAHASMMQSHFPSAMPQSAYMGPEVPAGPQDLGNFGNVGYTNANQQLAGRSSASTTPDSFPSMGGNPFG